MLAVNQPGCQSNRSAGQKRPGDLSRLIAQGLRSSETPPKKGRLEIQKQNPLKRLCRLTPLRGFWADAFFGASPVVASALGIRLGATPRGRFDSNTRLRAVRRKGDISTLLEKGTILFCVDTNRTNHCTRSKIGVYSLPLEEV
jgi:hypothetical protein